MELLDILPALAVAGGLAGVVGVAWWWQVKTRRAFIASFADDPELRALSSGGTFDHVQVVTKARASGDVVMTAAGGGKNDPTRWEARARSPIVARRTTLKLAPEGFAGHLREKLGMHDIHVGNERIDELLKIEGSDPDVVRALFSNGPVQSAALALFARDSATLLTIDDDGAVVIKMPRRGLNADEARIRMRHAIAMLDALNHAALLPGLPSPDTSDLVDDAGDFRDARAAARAAAALDGHGVGAESGTPVGIPLVGGKR